MAATSTSFTWCAILALSLSQTFAIDVTLRKQTCIGTDEASTDSIALLQGKPYMKFAEESQIGHDDHGDSATHDGHPVQVTSIPLRKSGVVLHMHFDNHQWSRNIKFFLEETPICHPDNFVACLFVSDWQGVDLPGLNMEGFRKKGEDIRMIDCPVNARRKLHSTGEAWAALYVPSCYAKSFSIVRSMAADVHGILFLEDDTVVVRPWRALSLDLQKHGGIVVPGIQDALVKMDTNLLDNVTWPEHSRDQWFWDADGPPLSGPTRLLSAVDHFNQDEKRRLGVTETQVPIFKASADVVYVPLSQGAEFERLADVFFKSGVFAEYAISNIARGIDGNHALLKPHEEVLLKSLWHEDRTDPFSVIKALPSNDTRVAFVHPVKLGGKGSEPNGNPKDNRHRLKALYSDIFAVEIQDKI